MQRRIEQTAHTPNERAQQEVEAEIIFKLLSSLQKSNHQSELTIQSLQKQLNDQATEQSKSLKKYRDQLKTHLKKSSSEYERQLHLERKGFSALCVRHSKEVKKLTKRVHCAEHKAKKQDGLKLRLTALENNCQRIKSELQYQSTTPNDNDMTVYENSTTASMSNESDYYKRLDTLETVGTIGSDGISALRSEVFKSVEVNDEGHKTAFIPSVIGLPKLDAETTEDYSFQDSNTPRKTNKDELQDEAEDIIGRHKRQYMMLKAGVPSVAIQRSLSDEGVTNNETEQLEIIQNLQAAMNVRREADTMQKLDGEVKKYARKKSRNTGDGIQYEGTVSKDTEQLDIMQRFEQTMDARKEKVKTIQIPTFDEQEQAEAIQKLEKIGYVPRRKSASTVKEEQEEEAAKSCEGEEGKKDKEKRVGGIETKEKEHAGEGECSSSTTQEGQQVGNEDENCVSAAASIPKSCEHEEADAEEQAAKKSEETAQGLPLLTVDGAWQIPGEDDDDPHPPSQQQQQHSIDTKEELPFIGVVQSNNDDYKDQLASLNEELLETKLSKEVLAKSLSSLKDEVEALRVALGEANATSGKA